MTKQPETLRLETFVVCLVCNTRVKPFILRVHRSNDQLQIESMAFECPSCQATFIMTADAIASSDQH